MCKINSPMTYSEYFEQLRKEFAFKTDAYLKAEKKLTQEPDGFLDKKILEDFTRAKIEWQNAANSYNSFLDFVRQQKIDPNDKMNIG
jgi:predicted HicB family RNase H-like nuclease